MKSVGDALLGGCFCGSIRYRVTGTPSLETNCHCSICRRTSGAPFVSWFTVAADRFAFTSGTPSGFRSSVHGTRTFCPSCGTPLTFQTSRYPGLIDVTIGSLNEPDLVRPKDHTHTDNKLSWINVGDLPSYRQARED